jgi:hypothetical protein
MRSRLLALAFSGVLVASSACSDATAPATLATPDRPAAFQGAQTGQHADGGGFSVPTVYEVTIDPRRKNLLHFGAHTLALPAKAVCSLGDSGYGIAVFDAPCTAETRPVTIRAKVSSDPDGRQRIDLLPQMRFNPTKTVVLSTYVGRTELLHSDSWRIFFCPVGGIECVDESLYDPSLTTWTDLQQGLVYRRIKHFSGYLAAES